jgi:hypothetical protein
MLELHDERGAFDRIEAYLRQAGFFGDRADGLCADLFLGYGLSRALRRRASPDPPEPCSLPLAACRIRPSEEPASPARRFSVGSWIPTWEDSSYADAFGGGRGAQATGGV